MQLNNLLVSPIQREAEPGHQPAWTLVTSLALRMAPSRPHSFHTTLERDICQPVHRGPTHEDPAGSQTFHIPTPPGNPCSPGPWQDPCLASPLDRRREVAWKTVTWPRMEMWPGLTGYGDFGPREKLIT